MSCQERKIRASSLIHRYACSHIYGSIMRKLILLMICAGASEASMAQWASAFTESAMGVSKTVGDLTGPCLFAVFMGISRILYGKMSEKLDLTKTMLACGVLCVICYLTASLASVPAFRLAGCALSGASVATVSSAMVGGISNMFGGNLKTGLLAASVFPLILILGLALLNRRFSRLPE